MRVKSSRFGCSGFSLVEIMCAILILGLALVGLTEGITSALTASKEAERQTQAALIAAGRIETLRAEGILMEGRRTGELEGGLSAYQWRESITSESIEGLYHVAVAVEDGDGRLIYELETMLFQPPLDSSSSSLFGAAPDRSGSGPATPALSRTR